MAAEDTRISFHAELTESAGGGSELENDALRGQVRSYTAPVVSLATIESEAGGLSPEEIVVGIEAMEFSLVSERYSGDFYSLLWKESAFTVTEYLRGTRMAAGGAPEGKRLTLTCKGVVKSVDLGEARQRTASPTTITMSVYEYTTKTDGVEDFYVNIDTMEMRAGGVDKTVALREALGITVAA